MDARLKRIADTYGKQEQLRQLMEECGELSVEASHSIRREGIDIAFIKEVADTEIMLEQIKYLFNIPKKDIDEIKEQKIARQIRRIENYEV